MRKQMTGLFLAVLLTVSLIAGCSGEENPGSARTSPNTEFQGGTGEEKEITPKSIRLAMIDPAAYASVDGVTVEAGTKIAVIGKQKDNPFWDCVEEGAKDAVTDLNEALGYSGKDSIQLTYDAPKNVESAEEQINILDETLGRNPDAICIAMIDEQACEVQFDQATENGIPVVALDSGSDDSTLISVAATDNNAAARTIAEQACSSIGDSGTIDVLVHDDSSESAKARLDGILEEIEEKHPQVTIGRILYLSEMNMDQMRKQIGKLLEDNSTALHPADAIIATNLTTLQALEAETDEESDVQIFGFDGGKDEVQAVETGELGAFILQNPYGMGYAAVLSAARALAGEANEYRIDTGWMLVTETNCDSEKVAALLYD